MVEESLTILLCTGEFPPSPACGGIGTATRAAAAALARRHDVHVLHCEVGLEPSDEHDPHGFTVHRRPIPRRTNRVLGRTGLSQAWAFRHHADAIRHFDIIEAPDWEAGVAGFVVRRRQPVVANLFTPTEVVRAHGSPAGGAIRARLERWACRRADAIASSGPPLSRELADRGWFPSAADMPVLAPCLDPETVAKPAEPLPSEPCVVGVGRLEPRKGFETVIRAAALLPSRPTVLLVGRDTRDEQGNSHGARLESLAGELDVRLRIDPARPLAELGAVYRRGWVVAVPSTFDSFSMAALEAAANARAVVGTTSVGFVDLTSTEPGVHVATSTPESFAEALGPLLADRAHATASGVAACETANRMFSPEKFAEERTALYRSLIAGSARPATIDEPSTSVSS